MELTKQVRQKWEYAHRYVQLRYVDEVLRTHGLEGWELVTVLSGGEGSELCRLFFKRPL